MPLGSLPFIPDDSRLILNTKPLGRDTAQRFENPVALYDVTEPLSYRSLTRHWSALTPNFKNLFQPIDPKILRLRCALLSDSVNAPNVSSILAT